MSIPKKIIGTLFLLLMAFTAYVAWQVLSPTTNFEEKKKSFFIKAGTSFTKVERNLVKYGFVKNNLIFNKVAKLLDYPTNIKAGKYVFEKNSSIYTILKTLRSGEQTPVKLLINKIRTKEELAQKFAANFECDSLSIISFLNSNDSLAAFQLDSNTVLTAIIPNTYAILWNTRFSEIFEMLYQANETFWTGDRKKQAAAHNLTPKQVYILASIVEEETNLEQDKGKIASVYINRLETGMRLGADPTVKYAMKDFSLKRIYHKYLSFPSPYNTYAVSGLPPGPICTPSAKTIDAVLNSPSTTYLYFVAKPDFSGYSNFAKSYKEHLEFAKAYQQALDTFMKKKAAGN